MFGLTPEKLGLIALIAVFIVGPQRLPMYASKLASWAREARSYLRDMQGRLSDELGTEFDEVDWKKLDPRQYDPRQIIRAALLEEPKAPSTQEKEGP